MRDHRRGAARSGARRARPRPDRAPPPEARPRPVLEVGDHRGLPRVRGRAPADEAEFVRRLRLRPVRTLSGVTPVTVLTKPFPCPGTCVFCPNDVRMPKSYLADEPGAQRAEDNRFDPYLQTWNRLAAFRSMGHPTDKVELIVLGGTWSHHPEAYQRWFVSRCFDALNDFGARRRRAAARPGAPAPTTARSRRSTAASSTTAPTTARSRATSRRRTAARCCTRASRRAGRTLAARAAAQRDARRRAASGSCSRRGPTRSTPRRRAGCAGSAPPRSSSACRASTTRSCARTGAATTSPRRARAFRALRARRLQAARALDAEPARRDARARRGRLPPPVRRLPTSAPTSSSSTRACSSRARRSRRTTRAASGSPTATTCWSSCSRAASRRRRAGAGSRAWCATSPRTTSRREPTPRICARWPSARSRRAAARAQEIRSREVRGRAVAAAELRARATPPTHTSIGREHFLEFVDARRPDRRVRARRAARASARPSPSSPAAALLREVHVYGASLPLGERAGAAAQHAGLGRALVDAAARVAREAGFALARGDLRGRHAALLPTARLRGRRALPAPGSGERAIADYGAARAFGRGRARCRAARALHAGAAPTEAQRRAIRRGRRAQGPRCQRWRTALAQRRVGRAS